MKVLFLAHSYPRFATDPVGSFVLRLAVALREAGTEVRVIAPSAEGLAGREEYEGIVVDRFRYAPRSLETLAYSGTMRDQVRSSWVSRLALASFLGADLWKTFRSRRDFRADLVHAHWFFPSGLIGTWMAGWWRVPLVTTLHGSDISVAKSSAIAGRMFRRVMTQSRPVTTVSSWLAAETRALVPQAHPVVAPMPIKPDLFHPGGSREPARLLFVGKLNQQKGIEYLLRALAVMRSHVVVDVIVGVGSAPEDIGSLAQSLGVADRLHWLPLLPQAKLAEYYRSCTALVMPAVGEGLGLVAAEALLCETPVIAFASGGLTDLIRDGETGVLVPTGDATALARAIDDVLSRADRGAALGRAGRRATLAALGPQAVAARYAALYREACEPHPRVA
jgi:glycosyltransferase involved in cell wall biosynthesis